RDAPDPRAAAAAGRGEGGLRREAQRRRARPEHAERVCGHRRRRRYADQHLARGRQVIIRITRTVHVRPRRPLPWGMLGPVIGLVLLALFALATSGCALTPMDRAVLSANAAATVGEQGREVLRDACTLRYQDALDRATLARVDAWCI